MSWVCKVWRWLHAASGVVVAVVVIASQSHVTPSTSHPLLVTHPFGHNSPISVCAKGFIESCVCLRRSDVNAGLIIGMWSGFLAYLVNYQR